jgi:murein L,D-transpeptidase YafK
MATDQTYAALGRQTIMVRKLILAFVLLSESAQADAQAKATRVVVKKADHEIVLYRGETLMKRYKAAIGPGGAGFKQREGDKVTPVGHFHVTMHQPSQFHLFLRLDYPTADDRARFTKLVATGAIPKDAHIGGDIGIHGAPPQQEWKTTHKLVDWTLGCVAVDDAEIDEIGSLVPDGTPVDIQD